MLTAETLTPEQAELILDPLKIHLIQQPNTVDMSRSGKNSVYFYCDIYSGRTSYAGCLHFLEAVANGLGHLRPDCEIALARGACPAAVMRKKELKAGKTLFFVDYEQWVIMNDAQKLRDKEESPIMYGKKRENRKFVPTTGLKAYEEDAIVEVKSKPEPKPKKLEKLTDIEADTNIMEKVLKERLKNDN